LGEGTQGSSRPSLKGIEHSNGRQESGSGWPQIDSRMTALSG
jgi:hypothetical protein